MNEKMNTGIEEVYEVERKNIQNRFETEEDYKNKILGMLNNYKITSGASYLVCNNDRLVWTVKNKLQEQNIKCVCIDEKDSEYDEAGAIEMILDGVAARSLVVY